MNQSKSTALVHWTKSQLFNQPRRDINAIRHYRLITARNKTFYLDNVRLYSDVWVVIAIQPSSGHKVLQFTRSVDDNAINNVLERFLNTAPTIPTNLISDIPIRHRAQLTLARFQIHHTSPKPTSKGSIERQVMECLRELEFTRVHEPYPHIGNHAERVLSRLYRQYQNKEPHHAKYRRPGQTK